MIGSTACGFVLAYLDYQIVLMFSMLTMCLSFITVPLCSSLMMLYCVMLVNGISGGFLVNAGNSMVIHCWGNFKFLERNSQRLLLPFSSSESRT